MDAIVQLIRNTLCCIKDLQLFSSSGIHNNAALPLPFPLNKTTYLEVLIGFTQLYAFASVSKSGLSLMIMKGFLKLRMAQKLLNSAKEKKGDPVNDLLVQRRETYLLELTCYASESHSFGYLPTAST
jgi:hypothetical protein